MATSIKISHRTIISTEGRLPADVLAQETGLSKQKIKLAMKQGAVWLARQGKPRRLRRVQSRLSPGDQLFLYYDERILAATPQPPQLIGDEKHYSVWFKPRGLLSQGSRWGDHCTLCRWIEQHHRPQRPVFLIHRLDRAASGLMLVGHTKKVAAKLTYLFAERLIDKRYRALVEGIYVPDAMPDTVNTELDGRTAISHISLIAHDSAAQRSLLDIRIDTGRKHQIRRHLQGIGLPIVGDRLYGAAEQEEDLQLTAWQLAFVCPISGENRVYNLDENLLPKLN